MQADYRWQLEYEKYLKDESYDRHTIEEIRLQRMILAIQKVALVPHLMKVDFASSLKSAYTMERVASISGETFPGVGKDILVKPWKAPKEIDFDKTHLSLIKISRELDLQCRKVMDLERKLNQW